MLGVTLKSCAVNSQRYGPPYFEQYPIVCVCVRAISVSLENVLLDVKELQRGMDLTKREYSMHGHNTMLKDFITHNEGKLKKLQDDAKIAQVNLTSLN